MSAPEISSEELRLLESLLERLSGDGAELPPVLFRFLTEIAATPNVDLLVRDDHGRVLLAWREDGFGAGWHVPGSIIRHREEIGHRIRACAADEFGCAVELEERPVALVQIFDDRGHSVSLCFAARLADGAEPTVIGADDRPGTGDLCWFDAVPEPLYPSHRVYRDVIAAAREHRLGTGIAVFTQHVGRRDAGQRSAAGAIEAGTSLERLD